MAKTRIPQVSGLENDGNYVFVAMDVYNAAGNATFAIRCRQADPALSEKECFQLLMEAINLENPEVLRYTLGGGRLSVSSANGEIVIGGSHPTFGLEPDRQKTAKVLRYAFPNRAVEILC